MSRRYLGPEFDIHGGGLDLRFPHHENELAQSTAAGDPFARYWVHNGLVTVNGQKMSKSLFNFVLAADALEEFDPLVIRYALLAAHYRSSLDVSQRGFDEARAAVDRIRTFLERVQRMPSPFEWSAERPEGVDADAEHAEPESGGPWSDGVPEAFASAMDDDLGVPQALAVVHEAVRAGNSALDAGDDAGAWEWALQVRKMTGILGVDPLDEQWTSTDASAEASALDALVQTMLAQRADARAAKDWAAADRIRDAIAAAGITLEDSADGTHWGIADTPAPRRGADGAQPRVRRTDG
jgi:cysteinyl-tRNA synthetase